MKKNLLIVFLTTLWATAPVKAQQATEGNLPIIGKEVKGQLNEATGWMYNTSKAWVSRKNRIPYNIGAQYKSLIDSQEEGLGNNRENFVYMELRTVTIDGMVYSLLLKVFNDGYFRDVAARKGWVDQTSITCYVFPTRELDKLLGLEPDKANNIKINTTYCITVANLDKNWNLHKLEKSLADFIASKEKPAFKEDLMINIKPMKDKIRFIINSGVSFTEPEKLTHYFYETKPEEFAKLFKIE
jgi:hypothetical protein